MTQFLAFDPKAEVNGAAVLAIVEGMGSFREMAMNILTGKGISNPRSGDWYLQQSWLDSFKEINEKAGAITLRVIGRKVPNTALWPPNVQTVEDALKSIDIAYQMNHRNGEIGFYHYIPVGRRSGRMECKNPYPCDFDMGLVESTARKFAGRGIVPVVVHDQSSPCRKDGADHCVYLISW